MAQITRVTSEALQAKIRQLLPSQQGFGEDLEAQNVIVPIIDLTETASGSSVRQDLQTALAYGSQDAFDVSNTTSQLITTTGFYRITGTATVRNVGSGTVPLVELFFRFNNSVNKVFWALNGATSSGNAGFAVGFDYVLFVDTDVEVRCKAETTSGKCTGSTRQIADINGNLINPSGFTIE